MGGGYPYLLHGYISSCISKINTQFVVLRLQSYRGRKPSGPVVTPLSGGGAGTGSNVSVVQQQQQEPPPSRPNSQPTTVHMLKPDQQQQPPMVSNQIREEDSNLYIVNEHVIFI